MKIFLSGQRRFGAATLDLISRLGHETVGVAAPAPDADGREDHLWAEAELRHVPLMASTKLNAETMPEGVDLIVCAHSHAFIGRRTRYKTRLGAIGYHPSLLPLHRGRDAVRWTIKMRDPIAGGSVYWLDDKVDGGPIAAQDYCFVHPEWTARELWRERLFPMGISLLSQTLGEIAAGRIWRVPQDEALATWEPAMNPPRLSRPDLLQLGDGTDNLKFIVERGSREVEFTRNDGRRPLIDRPDF